MKELFCLRRHLFRPTWPRRHQEKVLEHWEGKWGACVCRGKVGLRTRSCKRAPLFSPLQSLYLCKCTETQARDILESAHCGWQYYAWNRGKLFAFLYKESLFAVERPLHKGVGWRAPCPILISEGAYVWTDAHTWPKTARTHTLFVQIHVSLPVVKFRFLNSDSWILATLKNY